MKSPQQVIIDLLSQHHWYCPHEVRLQLTLMGCNVSPDSTTARMRDCRKVEHGGHLMVKRKRKGTDYFEYKLLQKEAYCEASVRLHGEFGRILSTEEKAV